MKPKERPMLFSAPMVRALLDGSKTQTRRVVSQRHLPQIDLSRFPLIAHWSKPKPYGHTGDRLWVRESWAPDPPCDGTWGYTEWAGCREGRIAGVPERFRHPQHCIYAATWKGAPLRWTPSIHMPRWASRITLDVTGVRVERLQDISDEDSLAEGVYPISTGLYPGSPIRAYKKLWESINGPGSWDANPWVWVVEFRRLS